MGRPSKRKRITALPLILSRGKARAVTPPPELEVVVRATCATTPEASRPDYTFARVSSRTQNHKGNLRHQQAGLVAHVAGLCGTLGGVWREVGSGAEPLGERRLAATLAAVAGGTLWAETLDRFLRSYWWETNQPNEWPSVAQVEELAALAKLYDVRLATVLPAWATMTKALGYHRKRGRVMADRRKRKALLQPAAVYLHGRGWSQHRIAGLLDVNQSNVSRWLG